MKQKLLTQYNGKPSEVMKKDFNQMSKKTVKHFRKMLQLPKKKLKILDIGFGEGTDLSYYQKQAGNAFGIDPSKDFLNLVQAKNIGAILKNETSEKTSFKNNFFDIVVSKYVLQTLPSLEKTYKEVFRILKKGGIFQFLVVHPMRQYFEKKDIYADYFEQKIVKSVIFDSAFTVMEPTHTFQEVLSKNFLEKFELIQVEEAYDFPATEQIEGRWYPTYLIIKAKKK